MSSKTKGMPLDEFFQDGKVHNEWHPTVEAAIQARKRYFNRAKTNGFLLKDCKTLPVIENPEKLVSHMEFTFLLRFTVLRDPDYVAPTPEPESDPADCTVNGCALCGRCPSRKSKRK